MAKGIFTTKVNPAYDDIPEIRYHFPRTYLNAVRKTVGDWIIYYEPRRGGGRLSYFAVAFVDNVVPDPDRDGHYYAIVSNYFEFSNPVYFSLNGKCIESFLNKKDGSISKGAFGRAVRLLPENEFNLILQMGFQEERIASKVQKGSVNEDIATFARPIIQQVVSRPFRDIQFSRQIRTAYDSTCAMTGLKLINGGGHCEIEAAHIRPVGQGHNGPDSVRNGIALSRTFHWMFDRGIISVSDDYRILMADQHISDQAKRMLNPSHKLILPDDPVLRPHQQFLEYHRNNIFKG